MKLKEFTEIIEKISEKHDVREQKDDYNCFSIRCKDTLVILHYMSEHIELPISIKIVNPNNELVYISFVDRIEYYWATERIILSVKRSVCGVVNL